VTLLKAGSGRLEESEASSRVLIIGIDLFPVDDGPKRVDVLGTSVLILEVVGVLPHVQAQNRDA